MAQRARKKSNYQQSPNGGNILFTLGLVSVVALLIVGWIMTQGGVSSLTGNGLNLNSISILPSPTPTTAPLQTIQVGGTTLEEIRQKHSRELEQMKQYYETKMQQIKQDYETKLTDLKTRIQLLEASNKRLRANKSG